MRVREADGVRESRADPVLGDHDHMPAMLLHVRIDRQVHLVGFAAVAVVMAQNAAALERITSHTRRLRGDHAS
ncbi:hypothetical protein DWB77_07434 [Streptomyces hundungensis]|uniref:Uncharacterized protein n=1 Tax=Streptomyces hundungensis TaxID=1077946 RepID=A0A387HT49_9ACTN|nr:hypothetical protein DWB77_07434 [Streptomyces hundungensis]